MDLIHFLKQSRNSRKIFGERELKIIEKQLLGVLLTQSEKNRLSRDIRPKLEFMKEINEFGSEFRLKKGARIAQFIHEAKEIILDDQASRFIQELILFGSVVSHSLTLRSDIDIAVKFGDISLKNATLFRKRVLGRVSDRLDIQVYNILPDKIKAEIDERGKIIYESTNKR